jgi:transmembrane sensor
VDDLIIRVLSGEASPFEVERLRRWRKEAPENDAYFHEIALVWELTAPEALAVGSPRPSVRAIIQAAASRTPGAGREGGPSPAAAEETLPGSRGGIRKGETRRRTTRPPWMLWGLLAASVAGVALGIQHLAPRGPEMVAEYAAPTGESQTVTLDDGSFVRLAAGSRLRVWGTQETREVSLNGRAFFAVTRDETRPFVVRVGPGEVRVLGTRFEVAEEADGVRTIVVEGRVSVSNDAGSVEVPAGSLAHMTEGNTPTLEGGEDVWALLEWPEGLLIFQGTPLSRVAEEVSRYFGRPLVVAAPDLGSRRITAWFLSEPFEEVAEAICMVVDASCNQEGGGVTLHPRETGGEAR